MREFIVDNPMECPFNSECQCNLYAMLEDDEQANKCPLGSYGNYKIPPLCPLLKESFRVSFKKGKI